MFCLSSLSTYDWSVAVYFAILGPRLRATMPDTPAPSSRAVDVGVRMSLAKRKLLGEAIQDAKRGVTFHTTVEPGRVGQRGSFLPKPGL